MPASGRDGGALAIILGEELLELVLREAGRQVCYIQPRRARHASAAPWRGVRAALTKLPSDRYRQEQQPHTEIDLVTN